MRSTRPSRFHFREVAYAISGLRCSPLGHRGAAPSHFTISQGGSPSATNAKAPASNGGLASILSGKAREVIDQCDDSINGLIVSTLLSLAAGSGPVRCKKET